MDLTNQNRSSLCDKCQGMLQGHWAERPSLIGGFGTFLYLQKSQNDFSRVESLPHSIHDLRTSIQKPNGCQLCDIIFGLFSSTKAAKLDVTGISSLPETLILSHQVSYTSGFISISFTLRDKGKEHVRHLYLKSISTMSSISSRLLVSEDILSDESINQATEWLLDCEKSHESCKRNSNLGLMQTRILPTRLIDVGTSPSPIIKLIHDYEYPAEVAYFSLSHCWGKKLPIKLESNCLSAFHNSISYEELPATFQDAIVITRKLKGQYLWIDALCIIQDSEEDWRQESSKMGQIYANSRLNFSATASSNSHGGMQRKRNPRMVGSCLVTPSWTGLNGESQYICCDKLLWERNFTSVPIQTRGWVLQERTLALRILHFAESQLFWECHASTASESMPAGLPFDIIEDYGYRRWPIVNARSQNALLHRQELLDRWVYLVETYTKTQLTYSKDKLVAISGIAQQFLKAWNGTPEEYIAGMWKHNIHIQLLWTVFRHPTHKVGRTPKPNYYRAPSWSWAAVDTEVYHALKEYDYAAHLAKIVEFKAIPHHDLSSSVVNAYIRLKGPICRLTAVWSDDGSLLSHNWNIDGQSLPQTRGKFDAMLESVLQTRRVTTI